ncbi:MAG: hypothetical protein H6R04_1049 [Burkholderiaceae bacterium]|nr:hypothetical protein [Burkholderiaceae bacterium]
MNILKGIAAVLAVLVAGAGFSTNGLASERQQNERVQVAERGAAPALTKPDARNAVSSSGFSGEEWRRLAKSL